MLATHRPRDRPSEAPPEPPVLVYNHKELNGHYESKDTSYPGTQAAEDILGLSVYWVVLVDTK
jgi:hypothetical protein